MTLASFSFRSLAGLALATGLAFGQLVIPSGTKVTCRLEQTISSSTAEEGQPVNLTVTEDVRINDAVVIKQGSTVYGTVIVAQEKRRMGRSGKLDFSIDKVRAADGEFIPLRYTPLKKNGESKAVSTGVMTAGAAVVFWPAAPFFLLRKGKDININKGITLEVFTDADHTLKSPAYRQAPTLTSVPLSGQGQPALLAQATQNPFAPANLASGNLTPADFGSLTIDADVEGAEVEVDGAFVGNTPSTRRLTPGNHTITVRDGQQVWERTIAVQPGDSVRIRAKVAAPIAPTATRATIRRQ